VGDNHPLYGAEVSTFYGGMKFLKRNLDLIPLSAELALYKIIAAPNIRLIDDASVERLKSFVAAGGTLLLNYRAATQNMDNSMRRTLAPGPFAEIAGVKSTAILDLFEYNSQNGNLDAKLQDALGIQFNGSDAVFKPRTAIETLSLHGAETLATVRGGGPMESSPVITRNRHGKGWVIYVGCDSTDDSFYEAVARAAGAAAGLSPLIDAPNGVEVTSRQDATTTYYFLLNLTEAAHDKIALPRPMDDVIAGRKGVTQISLGPFEVAVLAS
jgi:beta-galactosidase